MTFYCRRRLRFHGLESLRTAETANKTLYVYGPQAYTLEEALEIYVSICDPHLKVSTVPFLLITIISWLPGQELLRQVVIPLFRYFSKVKEPEGASAEASELLGAATTTLQAWCEKYKETQASKEGN